MIAFVKKHPNCATALAGLLGVVLLLCAAEGIAFLLLMARADTAGLEWDRGKLGEPDSILGARPRADCQVRAVTTGPEGVVYECLYTIDALHRRVTPVELPETRKQFALFFGCSFTFGEGVNDAETLPAQFAARAPDFVPYNYGYMAYGAQHMYLQVRRPELQSEIARPKGIAVYTFINDHLRRATGSLRFVAGWGRNLPDVTIEGETLVSHGTFGESRPLQYALGWMMNRSNLFALAGWDYPPHTSPKAYALVATLCSASARRLNELFPDTEFYVLIYPRSTDGLPLIPLLDAAGIKTLDYSRLLGNVSMPESSLFYADGHPTAFTQRLVAERLAMGLAGKTAAPQ